MRIVSLLPSATEIICILGLEDCLVAVTHECDYPVSVRRLPHATRTLIPHDTTSAEIDAMVRERLETNLALYSLDMEVLERLEPTVLVTQALCDVCAVAEAEVNEAACRLPGSPKVLNLEPMSVEDVLRTITIVGAATGAAVQAKGVVHELEERIRSVRRRSEAIPVSQRPRVAFIEWIDPIFNGGHWNPSLVSWAGGIDVLGNSGEPSKTTSWEALVECVPDVLFISCCGFSADRALRDLPILQLQPGWSDLPAVRNGRVYITDGNSYFSRPGPRLVDSLEILAHALHPGVHPLPSGLPPVKHPNCV